MCDVYKLSCTSMALHCDIARPEGSRRVIDGRYVSPRMMRALFPVEGREAATD